ncbi:hypothetical protein [endosymbiont GvMRE of Glomus versiforme]|uniref:hypothetical protein n=1 Tax=endosymbiont GvMRE of Glomus versiforme TaxID=2039283 RepID=UPI000ECD081A|nr:hypothetical protein [endosymbiont GvMRE of Glomus versiforme]RHZ36907.1 hypothetical protein GvMRE_I2g21 [endosymbiont GvMRE of Glomus versiforme]
MTELVIIKTSNADKLKTFLAKSHIEHEIIFNEPLTDKKTTKKDKLREYIEMKSKENIFADYGEAIKDKEREREIKLWEEADEEDEEELSKRYGR